MRTLAPAMGDPALMLDVLDGSLAVARLGPDEPLPQWAAGGPLCAVARTAQELSVVCPAEQVPAGRASGGRVPGNGGARPAGLRDHRRGQRAQRAAGPRGHTDLRDVDVRHRLSARARGAGWIRRVSVLRDAGHEVFTASSGGEVV